MEDIISLSLLFGTIASALFISSNVPMLVHAFKTKDLHSYSLAHLALSNIGNGCYWIYVITLPFGPVWLIHGFFTVTTALMLVWYLRYRCVQREAIRVTARSAHIDLNAVN